MVLYFFTDKIDIFFLLKVFFNDDVIDELLLNKCMKEHIRFSIFRINTIQTIDVTREKNRNHFKL